MTIKDSIKNGEQNSIHNSMLENALAFNAGFWIGHAYHYNLFEEEPKESRTEKMIKRYNDYQAKRERINKDSSYRKAWRYHYCNEGYLTVREGYIEDGKFVAFDATTYETCTDSSRWDTVLVYDNRDDKLALEMIKQRGKEKLDSGLTYSIEQSIEKRYKALDHISPKAKVICEIEKWHRDNIEFFE